MQQTVLLFNKLTSVGTYTEYTRKKNLKAPHHKNAFMHGDILTAAGIYVFFKLTFSWLMKLQKLADKTKLTGPQWYSY